VRGAAVFLETVDEAAARGDAATWYRTQRDLWGYQPNYAPAFALKPQVGLAWSRLSAAVKADMDPRRYELVTMAASRARASTYCFAAHASFLRDRCGDEPTMRSVVTDPTGASLDPVDAALVVFAASIATDPTAITADDVGHLRELGLSDEDVADVVYAVAARCFFATVLDATGAEPDRQLADTFENGVRDRLTVGRPFAAVPSD
jgi:uncharacterized peroxidase-related enzyme